LFIESAFELPDRLQQVEFIINVEFGATDVLTGFAVEADGCLYI